MKKLLLILFVVCLTSLIWTRQHARRHSIIIENERLAARMDALAARAREADAARENATRLSDAARAQLATRQAALAEAAPVTNRPAFVPPAAPDPAHQGGWPTTGTYLYIPKQYLTNTHYKLLEAGRLTDDAATLLGMSAAERSAVDQLYSGLLSQFRQLEINNMRRIPLPESWEGATFGAKLESSVACQISGLAAEMDAARQAMYQQLQQTLGSSRAQLLDQDTDAYLREHMDTLGADERTIAFMTATESDGSHAIWYGIADPRHGGGSFQRVGPDLAPDSQIAYYANLLGVQLPGQQ